ncbi:Ca2+-binding EF-hand superfamily protein [Rheinheimera pacifica]|uniref:EF-hand domain-containing protein n=1 Tax=Rheinheimera pacifica TaxID=173990 RepID=UPI002168B2AF|nr:EF-hand domain-containing protein [Rheinheimera pacifica]MCS4307533.1 Ca2+-binding EF-hand superfamily protein [Rheinheimera pacifica]
MKKHINSALVLALSLVSASALAADSKFNEIDQDNNGSISKTEFERHIGDRFFGKMDRNSDGMIDESEFSGTRFGSKLADFDRDGDSRLTQAELYNGLFEKFDTNRDMVLDKEEWKKVQGAGIVAK